MKDWRSRWNGLGRYGERQWTWDVTGAPDAMHSRWKYGIRFLYRIDSCGYVREYRNLEGKGEIGDSHIRNPLFLRRHSVV